jgi:hypothetical protein
LLRKRKKLKWDWGGPGRGCRRGRRGKNIIKIYETLKTEKGREGGREGGREEGREGGREGGRKEGREGGRESSERRGMGSMLRIVEHGLWLT